MKIFLSENQIDLLRLLRMEMKALERIFEFYIPLGLAHVSAYSAPLKCRGGVNYPSTSRHISQIIHKPADHNIVASITTHYKVFD